MPADDERTRRRLGDATRSRIAGLADGWSVDAPSSEPPPLTPDPDTPAADLQTPSAAAPGGPPASADHAISGLGASIAPAQARSKPKSMPPPPPGSPARKALEEQIVATKQRDDDATDEVPPSKRNTGAQPVVTSAGAPPTGSQPVARARPPTGSQPIARAKPPTGSQPVARAKPPTGSQPVARATSPTGSQPVPDGARPRPASGAHPVVRPRVPTGSQPVVPVRTQSSTGSQPIAGGRAKPPTAPPPPPPSAGAAARTKPSSIPPPPPGSADRSKPVSYPPPSAPSAPSPAPSFGGAEHDTHSATAAASSAAATGPRYPRAGYAGASPPLATRAATPSGDADARPFATEARTPAVIVDADAFAGNAPPTAAGELVVTTPSSAGGSSAGSAASTPKATIVPLGEFDGGGMDTKQITAKRDAAEALLRIPDVETPVEDLLDHAEDGDDDRSRGRAPSAAMSASGRGDPTAIDPQTAKFERGDPTENAPPEATEIQRPSRVKQLTGGTLRRTAALRRKRGLYGDVRYVFTAVFGVQRSRRELAELEHRQELRATSRRRHLVTLGRAAASMDNFDHPALGKSRDTLALIEDERAKHAGAVAASDAELDRVRRDRETNTKVHAESITKTTAELAELAKKIEPLEKEAAAARKKAGELREELHRIDKKIADTEALLVSVKGEKLDKANVQADIATYRANKQAVLRDEPVIAAELDALNPRIAALEATRAELEKKKADLEKADQEDQRRTLELLEAIGAKRKVVERASADAETARDNALFELGERLYHDRPQQLTPQLSPIDRIDLEIGEDERRSMELKEILSNVDKAKLARGLAMIILAVGVGGSLAWWIIAMAS